MAKDNLELETIGMDVFSSTNESVLTDMQEILDNVESKGLSQLNEEVIEEDDNKELIENKAEPVKKEESVGKKKDVESPVTLEEKKTSSPVSANKLYSAFAKSLKDTGAFHDLELSENEEIDSADALNSKIESLIQKRVEESLSSTQKEYKEAINAGMPIDEFKDIQNKISQIDSIDLDGLSDDDDDTVELRFNIIKNNYLLQGIKADKADRLAKASLKDNTDIVDSKEALMEVREYYVNLFNNKKEEYSKETAKRKDEESNLVKQYEEKLNKTEDIAGFKIDNATRKKILENTTKVIEVKNGRQVNALMKDRLSNPEEFDMKLNFIHVVTKGFKDFSYFTNKGKKQAESEFDKLLQTNSGSFMQNEPKSFSFLDDINENEQLF